MGMPITIEIASTHATNDIFETVFGYFSYIDGIFSTYKTSSEISGINRKELARPYWSDDMETIFALAETAKEKTGGYFDIQKPDGSFDPSGIVKGWAIQNAATIIRDAGFIDFYIDAGGDIQTSGTSNDGEPWLIGIKNPFNQDEIIKTIYASGTAIATSGTYIRGLHIYNPKTGLPIDTISSLTVVGKDIYDVDLLATSAFAMGTQGIDFIESIPEFEGYSIDTKGIATMTTGFEGFIEKKQIQFA
jgi:thiamine biosynthesis lipoprotein